MIHTSSVVDPRAHIGRDVEIGPYCVIEGDVVIGDRCRLISHVCLRAPLTLGRGNTLYPFTCVGFEPQDYKFRGSGAGVVIGDDNTFRESVTVHAATGREHPTRLGNSNLLMTCTHIGHDVSIGSRCTLVTGSSLGGHADLEDDVTIGGNSCAHQFCRLGRMSFLGAQSIVTKDVPPFALATGFNQIMGVNLVGLRRGGIARNVIDKLKAAYETLYLCGHTLPVAATMIENAADDSGLGADLCNELAAFIRASSRGLVPHIAMSGRHKLQR